MIEAQKLNAQSIGSCGILLTPQEIKLILRIRQLKDALNVLQVIVDKGEPKIILLTGKAEGLG